MSASDLRAAGIRLTGSRAGFEPLKAAPTKGARPGTVATGRPSSAARGTNAELVESDFALREYYDAVEITSTDGIFTLEVEPIRVVRLEGGGFLEFQEPA